MPDKPKLNAPIDMDKLGYPGVRGELHVLAIFNKNMDVDEARLADSTSRIFLVSGLLSKFPSMSQDIRGDFSDNDGNTYLTVADGTAAFRVSVGDSFFEIKKNKDGELSLVAFRCTANSISEAKKSFYKIVLPYLDFLGFIANCPLYLLQIRIEDEKNGRVTLDYMAPYKRVSINPHKVVLYPELAPIYSLYREAKNSSSDFYRFLCYYKIMEGLLNPLRANVFKAAKEQGIDLKRPRDVVPDHPEMKGSSQSVYIGKSIKKFYDDVLTPEFRNAIAHFGTDDDGVLNISDYEHYDKYANIILISELCVRALISTHESLLSQIAH